MIENQLKGIIESSSELIAGVDLNGRYIIFNSTYEREFKRIFNKQITLGMSLEEALSSTPDYKLKILHNWKRAIAGEEFTETLELGENMYEVLFSTIRDGDNNQIGASIVIRNITQKIHQEQEMQDLNNELIIEMNKLDSYNKKMTLLVEMSDTLQACATVEEVSRAIAKFAKKILDFAQGILYIMLPTNNYLEAMANWGNPSQQPTIIATDQCWALRRGRLYQITDIQNDLPCAHILISEKPTPYICMPLVAQNNIYGLLYLEILMNSTGFFEHRRILIAATAEAAALALANVRLRDMLRTQSIHDSLTGLYNRRFLEEFLTKEFNQIKRKPTPIAIIMLDIDFFKKFNDKYGHELGDKVLEEVGKILQNEARSGDVVCRYGGEEFIWVLHDCTLEFAIQRAEDLRKKINTISAVSNTLQIEPVAASIGVAIFPENGNTSAELINAADKALYEAKRTGGNKIVIYSEKVG